VSGVLEHDQTGIIAIDASQGASAALAVEWPHQSPSTGGRINAHFEDNTVKSAIVLIGIALAAVASPTAVSAQMGGGRGGMAMMGRGMMNQDCPMMGMMPAGQEARLEQRLNSLKTQLAIKPEQEAAWTAYVAAAKKTAEGAQGVHQTMRQSMGAKSPVERIDSHLTAIEGHANLLRIMKPALATLYDALSAEQKVKANAVLGGRGCMM
jgi:hypothetical protein